MINKMDNKLDIKDNIKESRIDIRTKLTNNNHKNINKFLKETMESINIIEVDLMTNKINNIEILFLNK